MFFYFWQKNPPKKPKREKFQNIRKKCDTCGGKSYPTAVVKL